MITTSKRAQRALCLKEHKEHYIQKRKNITMYKRGKEHYVYKTTKSTMSTREKRALGIKEHK